MSWTGLSGVDLSLGNVTDHRRVRRIGVIGLIVAMVAMLVPVSAPAASAAPLLSRIVGYVQDGADNPVPGIEVSVFRYFDDVVDTATTDAAGEFAFDLTDTPPGGEGYTVTFRDPANTLGYVEFSEIFIQPGYDELLGVTMTPGGRISGTVTFPGGAPVTDACADLYGYAGSFKVATICADPSGAFTTPTLSNGRWNLSFTSASQAAQPTSTYATVTAPQTTTANVRMASVGNAIVQGVVVAPDGTTPVPACIGIYGPASWFGCTDLLGAFTSAGLEPGAYDIYVTPNDSDYLQTSFQDVPISAGINPFTAEVKKAGRVVGTVTQPGGAPAQGVRVSVCNPAGFFGCRAASGIAVTGSDGAYEIAVPSQAGVEVLVAFTGSGWAPEWHDNLPLNDLAVPPPGVTLVPIVEGIDTTVNAEVAPVPLGVISGTLTDSVSLAPIVNGSVTVALSSAPSVFIAGAPTDASGQYTLDGLEPGTYIVRAAAIGYQSERWVDLKNGPGAPTPVVVTSGATASGISFALDPQGVIRGLVDTDLPAVGGSTTFCVRATPTSGAFDPITRCRPLGTEFQISKLPSGTYDLQVTSDDYVTQTITGVSVTTPNTTVQNVVLVRKQLISGVVTDASTAAPLQGAYVCTSLSGSFSIRCGYSAPDGTYAIAVGPGTYKVQANLSLYATEYFDDTALFPGDDVIITAGGGNRTDVDFTLVRQATIAGTVTSGGSGLCGVQVEVLDASTQIPVAYGSTRCAGNPDGPAGSYTVVVNPGTYVVRFNNFNGVYRTEYWNDAADFAAAEQITLTVSENESGIDADLLANPTVTGTITEDGTGAPVAGVRVQLTSTVPGVPSPTNSAFTSSTGTYVLPAPEGAYKIKFDASRHRDEWFDNAPSEASATTVTLSAAGVTANASLAPLRRISGRVTGPLGQPLVSSPVQALFSSGPTAANAFTNSNGIYEMFVEDATYVVRFGGASFGTSYAREYYDDARRFSDATLVSVVGADAPNVDAQLSSAGSISGTLAAGSSFSTRCVQVFDVALGSAEPVDTVCTNSANYTVSGLLPGAYRVYAYFVPPGYVPEWYQNATTYSTATDVVVTAGATSTANIVLDLAGSAITGQVTDSSGVPLAGVTVGSDGGSFSATTDALGNFRVVGLADSATGYRVFFVKNGYASEFYNNTRFGSGAVRIPINGSDVGIGVIALDPVTAFVSGTVTEEVSAAVPATPVCIAFTEVDPVIFTTGFSYQTCTSSGSYSIALPEGDFQVNVFGQSSPTRYLSGFPYNIVSPFTAVNGPQTLALTIERGAVLSGRVVQEGTTTGIPGVSVTVVNSSGGSVGIGAVTTASGNYVLNGLRDGDYSVRFSNFSGRYISEYLGGSLVPPGSVVTVAGADQVLPDAELGVGAIVTGTLTDSVTGLALFGCVSVYPTGTTDLIASGCTGSGGNYSTTGLPNGTFDVVANASGYVSQTKVVTVSGGADQVANFALVSLAAPVGTVRNLTAVAGNGQVELSWAEPLSVGTGIEDYDVYVDDGSGSGLVFLASTGGNTSYTATGLTNGETYEFAVYARAAGGAGPASTISATPLATVPDGVQGVSAVGGLGEVTVSWTAGDNGGLPIIDSRVQVLKAGVWTWGATAVATATDGVVKGLVPETTYSFRVRSQNALGWGPWSTPVLATTLPGVPPVAPPQPTAVTGVAGDASVSVSWTMGSPGTTPIIDTRVQRSTNGGATWQWAATAIGTSTSAFATGLTNGQSYVFRVRAQNSVGWGPWSAVTGPYVPTGVLPPPPSQIVVDAVIAGIDNVTISWTQPSANGGTLVDTRVQISADNGATWQWAATALPGQSEVTITGLAFGDYLFRLRAQNEAGWGSWSASVLASVGMVAGG